MANSTLEHLIKDFSTEGITRFFRERSPKFAPRKESLDEYNDELFKRGVKLGEIKFDETEELIVCAFSCDNSLSERSGKKAQYEKAKRVLKGRISDAGIFVFYDADGNFRFSLIYTNYLGKKKDWSTFKRFTYFVSKEFTNKTFLQRIGEADFSSLDKIQEAFSVEKVTKEFYENISYWYFWAVKKCVFPKDAEAEENGRNISVIRLITRIIFVWFMRERKLISKELFDKGSIDELLIDTSDEISTYYQAILQNLFFATLSTKQEERQFRSEIRGQKGFNSDHGNPYVFRFHEYLRNPDKVHKLFVDIPFLNGGLFDCLDDSEKGIYIDGFSETKKNQALVPNELFFGKEKKVDLSSDLGDQQKKCPVQGLLNLLSEFNFTIDENTSDDKDVALDPELLGRVFENLLASFNPETSMTARKSTGSYYTPPEVVNFMVDESLKAYFRTHLSAMDNYEAKISVLINNPGDENPFSPNESLQVVRLIENLRIIDPAVGSGAFPMTILARLVELLHKVDPNNDCWKKAQLDAADNIPDSMLRQETKTRIETIFRNKKNENYRRKIFLIQKCIYGVDIQQIAVEIAKLRFFISLLVDEEIDFSRENFGILPLPNLDFKIMQGDSLITNFNGISFEFNNELKEEQLALNFVDNNSFLISKLRDRKDEYQITSDKNKKKELLNDIEQIFLDILEQEIKVQEKLLQNEIDSIEQRYSFISDDKKRVSIIQKEINKKKQIIGSNLESIKKEFKEYSGINKTRQFFLWNLFFAEVEKEKGGFDIVIGNPPYIQLQTIHDQADKFEKIQYETFARTGDIYCLFYERGFRLLIPNGILAFITSNKWMRAGYGETLRDFFIKKTNPLLLIDFSGQKIFESVTVDVNILLFQKTENKYSTKVMTVKDKNSLNNLSALINQQITSNKFDSKKSWSILSDIEHRIKSKIEEVGVPLKDWDISINYGIKTGFNEAFIISNEKKKELIEADPKSAEIIRPILRGRDIKRYGYDFADLWLLFIPWHFPLQNDPLIKGASEKAEEEFKRQYPAIYNHLFHYKKQLSARNKTETGIGYEWYALQRWGANYWDDFYKQKIMYPNMTKYLPFYLDTHGFYQNDKSFFITGSHLSFLCAFLNSSLFKYCFSNNFPELQGGTRELRKIFFDKIPIMKVDDSIEKSFNQLVIEIQKKKILNDNPSEIEHEIDNLLFDLYHLSTEEKSQIGFIEVL
jgi:hypothetical protein